MEDFQRDPWGEPRSFKLWWIAGLSLLVLAGIVVYSWEQADDNAAALAKITADPPRLTLANDDGGNLVKIDRQTDRAVFCRVAIHHAPFGERVELVCEWVAPDGNVMHRNRYRTKPINSDPWPTHARFPIGVAIPLGQWTIRMLLAGRELTRGVFTVENGPVAAAEIPGADKAAAIPGEANP